MSSLFQRLARRYIMPPVTKNDGIRRTFDIEANDLLDTATTVHCIVIADLDSDKIYEYGPQQIAGALAHLSRADYLTGHNIQAYDIPLLQRLYGWAPSANTEIVDTLVTGRLILPNLGDIDDQVAAMDGSALGKLRGRYSIEAWGVRLGVAKVGVDIKDFSAWTPELQARCVGDVKTTKALWHFLEPDGYTTQAIELEHRVNAICNRIEADGIPFDDVAAERLEQQWSAEYTKMEAALREQFPDMKPGSRIQVAKHLEARGWIAEERTEKTKQPKITDELLETIPQLYPEFASLIDYHILRRRIAQLSKGKKAWRKNVGKDGHLHGGIIHIGTPHSRAAHAGPNLAQVPSAKRGTPFAAECRALFRAPEGWSFVACDQATLQDRTFAHYLSKFDCGAYAEAFLRGDDQHWKSAITLDLIPAETTRDKQNKIHEIIREGAKGFRYGFLFGAQNKRAGQIIYKITRAVHHIDPSSNLHHKFFPGASRPSEDALTRIGQRARNKFEAGTPGLGQLRRALRNHAERHGWLFGLDGRRVPVRALYSALNFVVTSAEAIICKRWLVQVYDELCARFRYGWDGDVVIALWIHDEIACCCRLEIAAEIGKIMVRHAKAAGEFYGLRVPLDADYKIGRDWAGEPVKTDSIEPLVNATIEDASEETNCENLDDDKDASELPPAYQINWGTKLEQDFPRAAAAAPPPHVVDDPPPQTQAPPSHAGNGRFSDDNHNNDEAQQHPHDEEPPRRNGSAGNTNHSSYNERALEKDADKPYAPVRAKLLARGYQLARTFSFTVPGENEPRFFEDRYELRPKIVPTKERPRKTHRFRYCVNGQELNGTGPRRIIYNWPAIMRAGRGAFVFATEGANKSEPLNARGLLATAAPYHRWKDECADALAGDHLIYLEDHNPDGGNDPGPQLAAAARKQLASRAASFRIVPTKHLWTYLPPGAREIRQGEDVKNWLELGGDAAKLLDICREIPADGIITAEPYQFRAEADIAPWQWLYGRHLLRGEVSGTAAMGGTGKSTLSIVEALTMTSAHALVGETSPAPLRVILVNLEDTRNTMDKRITAVMHHYGLTPADIGDRLIVKAKGEIKIKVARQLRSGDVERNEQVIRALIGLMLNHHADVLSIDSFIRTHRVHENDNSAIQEVVECFEDIATEAQCAVHLWHHTRKAGGEKATIETTRGAIAFVDACRSARVLETMSTDEHTQLIEVAPDMLPPGFYFRAFNGKRNFAPPAAQSDWFKLESVVLRNGDDVGVATAWHYPETWEDVSPEITTHILDDIERGMPNGQRYSNYNAAKKRAAWLVVREHFPGKTQNQCRAIIAAWIRKGLLYEDEYEDPVYRKRQVGLFTRQADT